MPRSVVRRMKRTKKRSQRVRSIKKRRNQRARSIKKRRTQRIRHKKHVSKRRNKNKYSYKGGVFGLERLCGINDRNCQLDNTGKEVIRDKIDSEFTIYLNSFHTAKECIRMIIEDPETIMGMQYREILEQEALSILDRCETAHETLDNFLNNFMTHYQNILPLIEDWVNGNTINESQFKSKKNLLFEDLNGLNLRDKKNITITVFIEAMIFIKTNSLYPGYKRWAEKNLNEFNKIAKDTNRTVNFKKLFDHIKN